MSAFTGLELGRRRYGVGPLKRLDNRNSCRRQWDKLSMVRQEGARWRCPQQRGKRPMMRQVGARLGCSQQGKCPVVRQDGAPPEGQVAHVVPEGVWLGCHQQWCSCPPKWLEVGVSPAAAVRVA